MSALRLHMNGDIPSALSESRENFALANVIIAHKQRQATGLVVAPVIAISRRIFCDNINRLTVGRPFANQNPFARNILISGRSKLKRMSLRIEKVLARRAAFFSSLAQSRVSINFLSTMR